MPAIDDYLRALRDQKATALHLSAGRRPMLRIASNVVPIQGESLLDDLALRALLKEALGNDRWDAFQRDHDCDFTMTAGTLGRYHGNCLITETGLSAVFERIEDVPESLDHLGLPSIGQSLIGARAGLILVCGPHGSGKSTTIAALIDQLNATQRLHIVSLEAPIRVLHRHQRSIVSQREVGRDTGSFANAIRAALKQDVDVIAVSELSERETITHAIDAAHQGVLVLAEAHSSTPVSAIEGLLGAFPEDARVHARAALSENLLGVIGQVLCRHKDGGRVAVYEVVPSSRAFAEAIRNADDHAMEQHISAGADGSHRLDDSLAALVEQGAIDGREAHRRAREKKRFAQHAPSLSNG